MVKFGVSKFLPLKYTGPDVNITPIRDFPHQPLPTNKNFPVGQLAILRKNPTTGVEGELWYLCKFFANGTADWKQLGVSAGGGTVFTLSDTASTTVSPDVFGNIQLEGSAGITVTSVPLSNKLTFALAGGSTAIDQIAVQASSGTGTNPVLPHAVTGELTMIGGQAAAGSFTTGIQTKSESVNSLSILALQSSAIAAPDATVNGISHFNSAMFTVDATGFVSLKGGGIAVDQINVDATSGAGTDPVVPTATGEITVTGGQIATGTIGANVIRTISTAANSYTVQIQQTDSVAAKDTTKNGVAHFNSAHFTDDEGFISLTGGGIAIDSVTVDTSSGAGTNPVAPNGSGEITVTGAQVAPGVVGANVIRTDSLAANTYTIEIQQTSAVAAKDTTKNGVSHFNSSHFTNDQGFISLSGGGLAVDSFTVQAVTAPGVNPVTPDGSGIVTVNGAVVANHSVPLESRSRAVNAYNLEVQYATSAAATDGTKSGVAHFDSARFTVDASGFVTTSGSGVTTSIGVDVSSGGGSDPVVPAAGVIDITGAQVAAGTVGANVIRTNSTVANQVKIEVQRSTAVASTASLNNGVCHFDSADFSVDANGFVTFVGTGMITWQTISASQTLVINNGYICISPGGALSLPLPATATIGDIIEVTLDGATSFAITQAAGQSIRFGSSSTTVGVGGSLTTISQGNTLRMVAQSATKWNVISSVGNFTLV